ncbi:GNAT family N-acetyltransferase [Mariluticola halotolerans]|uniref:GNAT family N-acetyltransferase n=1 Tax=Mariluticola halotolerans TaxID=2909283 RepID=UPI0026E2DA08|nr:GNAT family N-acetyltransferase [Mariluticola halotolerans]UJQ95348.1 GNAT family N-acetyltransferase [Mariluticola halotolerans]
MLTLFTTQRCVLRTIDESDFAEVAQLYDNPDIGEFLGGRISPEDFEAKFAALLVKGKSLVLTVRLAESEVLIGLIALTRHHDRANTEISFQFLPQFQGRGYAHETLTGLADYAFETLNVPRLIAKIIADDARSKQVVTRLGMREIRTDERDGVAKIIYGRPKEKAEHDDVPGLQTG